MNVMCEGENAAWECEVLHSLPMWCFFYAHPGKELERTCSLNMHLGMDNLFQRKECRINLCLVRPSTEISLCILQIQEW